MSESKTTPDPDFVCISVLEFSDKTFSAMMLSAGSLESCQKMMKMVPAVSYSGEKEVSKSFLKVLPVDQWREACVASLVEAGIA